MLKNKHLLGIIVGLSGLTALVGVVLVFSEKTNASRIDTLNRDLADARRRQDEMETAFNSKVSGLSGELAAARQQMQATERDLGQTHKAVEDVRVALGKLQGKKWLASDGDEPPWGKDLAVLDERLDLIEKLLKKLPSR